MARPLALAGLLLVAAATAAATEPTGVRWSFKGEMPQAFAAEQLDGSGTLPGVPSGKAEVPPPNDIGEGQSLHIPEGAGFVRVADPGPSSLLDFGPGDELTIEAMVSPLPGSLGEGRHLHVVGKGRTNNPGAAADNLNYTLRLTGKGEQAALSFLFRSAPDGGPGRGEYHRWTSTTTFPADGGWHHIAVTYRFGAPDSLHGYIDGRQVEGEWDMGGATAAPPAVDDDELWIGSGAGGGAGGTFHGRIDEVIVRHGPLDPESIRFRVPVVAEKPSVPPSPAPADRVLVEVFERFPANKTWPSRWRAADESYAQDSFGFSALRKKYDRRAVQVDRTRAFGVRASSLVTLPPGEYELLIRAHSAAKLIVDGNVVATTPFFSISSSGHGHIRDFRVLKEDGLRLLQPGDNEAVATVTSDGSPLEVRLEFYVGGAQLRPELGETAVFVRPKGEREFHLLGHGVDFPLTDAGWLDFAAHQRADLLALNAARRREVAVDEDAYWQRRHEFARAVCDEKPDIALPSATPPDASPHPIDRLVAAKLTELGVPPAEPLDDQSFVRRVTLDLLGTIPTPEQIDSFYTDSEPGRRDRYVDRLLDHPGWADHWVAEWQDALAENPNLINPTLNNTGPFRWWLHESFAENKPFDRFATELIRMEGGRLYGGPGGFEMATQNDVPMAAKAHVLGQALLGVDFSCARCHDSPSSDLKQADLFGLAAMLRRGPQEVPLTSSVPPNPDPNHVALVEVTLKPGTKVSPAWTLADVAPGAPLPADLLRDPSDERERFAAIVTSPHNDRFAKVIVNRVWKRYLGRGLVEPVHNWIAAEPLDPALLDFLAREFVLSGYDLKALARLILTSETYRRTALADPASEAAGLLPVRRRMTAEQLVDSMFLACGKRLNTGELAIDADGARELEISLNLGRPLRAWEFTSLSNERDRPSLSLPRAQPFVTTLEAFGWQGARQGSVVARDGDPNVLQPGLLANGVLAKRFTRLSDDSAFTALALTAANPEALAEATVVRILARPATPAERTLYADLLRDGFADRVVPGEPKPFREYTQTGVSWSNQHDPRATQLQEALAEEVAAGDAPTERLTPDWRERYEDALWSLLNSPEFVFVP